jgi:hypothetical protein
MTYSNDDERFHSKIRHEGDCWIWTAQIIHGNPYFHEGGTRVPARRYAYETEFLTTLPPHKAISPNCGNDNCVNPEHMEVHERGTTEYLKHGGALIDTDKPNRNSTTGIRGVRVHGNGYRGRLAKDGKRYTTATFPTIEEAAEATAKLRKDLLAGGAA